MVHDAALTHAMLVASYLAGGPAFGFPLAFLIGGAVPTALRGKLLPRWLGWLGIVGVALSAASALSMLGPTSNRSAIYGVLLAGAVVGFVWLVSASLVFALGHRGGEMPK